MQYLDQNYKDADSLFNQIQTDYPDNDFDPQIDLVRALIKAREGKKEEYRGELQAYMDDYKTGKYHDYAQNLADKFDGKKPTPTLPQQDSSSSPTSTLPILDNSQSSPKQAPNNAPQNNPTQTDDDSIPPEIQKLLEEQMKNRGNRGGPPTQNMPPNQQSPNTPATTTPNNADPSSPVNPAQNSIDNSKGF
jgi:hypothetical protein